MTASEPVSPDPRTPTAASSDPTSGFVAADSFRVRTHPVTGAAEVRGWTRHLARFRRAVTAATAGSTDAASAPSDAELDAFLRDAAHRIAAFGPGFPRLEARRTAGAPELGLTLRPAPPLGRELALRTAPGVALVDPGRKGPNLERLAALNRTLGAEALLIDAEGHVLEGATTSLIWWRPGDARGVRVADPQDGPGARVPSVTESLITDAARRSPLEDGSLRDAAVSPAELADAEVWAVNALHGIRVVTTVDGHPTHDADQDRLAWFRAALDRSWEPVEATLPTAR